ncbi:Amino-oxidase domain-containing protein [Mycena indigotica]|uniref:Amino-oxidase domain-containing protein n=1 Tax=Mycena indigotica TaxID=2126181 RepID=A0A8H6W8R1_9AGAR|nr:Amino-oxidase domain-containing protein [Mycena indigotica]KAF7309884.1 Amino-oxidase domain-containing protein [Mycena indigotica]
MKVAVVGSGAAGLAATWLLNQHSEHEVHLYEADSRPGGHANTVKFTTPGRAPDEGVYVDTGFIVFNPSTYPNFIKFLKMEGIKYDPTEMTFSVTRDAGAFEWAGNNLFTVFCQPYRLLDPSMWRLVYDVLRFNAYARNILSQEEELLKEMSIGEYLDRQGYSDAFKDNYLIPMTACIWSTPPDKCALDFPARTLVQFLSNHHLLQITGKPSWLTIEGGSREYVNKIISNLPQDQLHLATPVASVSTEEGTGGIRLTTSNGETQTTYDHVIFACHSDTTLAILRAGQGMTVDEERILKMFQWNRNEAVLHSDVALMPRSRLAWTCWNYLTRTVLDTQGKRKANSDEVSLTCNKSMIHGMNDLQHLPLKKHGPVLVTLNPPFEPREDLVAGRWKYDHPVLDANAIRAQKLVRTIQRTRGISYAGAWLKYGFHEDAFASGLDAARHLISSGRPLPFDIDLEVDRKPPSAWLAVLLLMLFEKSGAEYVVGTVGAWACSLLGWVVWRVFGWGARLRDEADARRKMKVD